MDSVGFDFLQEILEFIVDALEEIFEIFKPCVRCSFDVLKVVSEIGGHWHREFNKSKLFETGIPLDFKHEWIVEDHGFVGFVQVDGDFINYFKRKSKERLLWVIIYCECLVGQHCDIVIGLLESALLHGAGNTWRE